MYKSHKAWPDNTLCLVQRKGKTKSSIQATQYSSKRMNSLCRWQGMQPPMSMAHAPYAPAGHVGWHGYHPPLLKHLTEDGCIGSISEIFDGDQPHRLVGCFAQAWSLAEVIKDCLMIID
jgi:hypothetical protein